MISDLDNFEWVMPKSCYLNNFVNDSGNYKLHFHLYIQQFRKCTPSQFGNDTLNNFVNDSGNWKATHDRNNIINLRI